MKPVRISRVLRCHLTKKDIANIIELIVFFKLSQRSIARTYGISDKTVGSFLQKYYYGVCGKNSRRVIIRKQSQINEDNIDQAAA